MASRRANSMRDSFQISPSCSTGISVVRP
jgi:hypothetical protein